MLPIAAPINRDAQDRTGYGVPPQAHDLHPTYLAYPAYPCESPASPRKLMSDCLLSAMARPMSVRMNAKRVCGLLPNGNYAQLEATAG